MEEKKKTLWQRMRSMGLNIQFTALILLLVFVPIVVISIIMFRQIEQNSIAQNKSDMYYRQRELDGAVTFRMEAMETLQRSFSNSSDIRHILRESASERTMSTRELLDFADGTASILIGMVDNNPLVYTARVYAINDNVQEMMPSIYKASRMKNLSWSSEEPVTGWHFAYYDTTFGSLTENGDVPLLGLVSPVEDYTLGTIGYVEVAAEMRNIFPDMYAEGSEGWGFFIREDGEVVLGDAFPEQDKKIAEDLAADKPLLKEQVVEQRSVNGRDILFYTIPIGKTGGTYVEVEDITGITRNIRFNRNNFFVTLLIVFVVMLFGINAIVRRMLGRLYSVVDSMRQIRHGDLSIRTDVAGTDEIGELAHQFNRMLDRIEQLTEENVQREILAKNAGIRSLQNQINAHFIYNVLESIKMLAEMRSEYEISDAITSLGKLLRYSMRWESGTVTLEDELEYVDNYLALMNFRNDFTVGLAKNLPDSLLNQEIPKMSLQPIIENCVLHGISPLGEDASIYIKGWESGEDVWIEISDNGQGMPEEALLALRQKLEGAVETEEIAHKGHGVGMKNVNDRMMLEFGKEYGLTVASEEGKYTKITMHLPKRKGISNAITVNR